MLTTSFETLMRHHAWAVERLLDTAALVAPDQLDADVLSHGSMLATLRHVADVDQSWGRTARGHAVYEVGQMEAKCGDLPSLRAFWLAEVAGLVDFVCGLSPVGLDRDVKPSWRPESYAIWQILWHISNHRAEHGNQIGWQLAALGHSPGDLGFMGFVARQRQGAV